MLANQLYQTADVSHAVKKKSRQGPGFNLTWSMFWTEKMRLYQEFIIDKREYVRKVVSGIYTKLIGVVAW